ncbi:MAG: fructosamine kinase family protein [Verrucomicrobiae bacterium]|nr:fructosamine kinase family protein [Verrucomicrobiae bacterium]
MADLWSSIAATLTERLGIDFKDTEAKPVGGGCINESFLLTSPATPGRRVFVKLNAAAKLAMFEAESAALIEIAATEAIRVPLPLACGAIGDRAFLAMEAVALTNRSDPASQRRLGENLAALHRIVSSDGRFGWHRDNTIGELPQPNEWTDSWIDFFRDRRLGHQFALAEKRGRPIHGAAPMLDRLPELLADHEPAPSLLHGDLWGGNAAFAADTGEPVIYDPASYYGDRETDLAFTELFGGFGPDFYTGYRNTYPLNPGYDRRRNLYNLYHLVNHANHFGDGYASQAEAMIAGLLK